MFERWYGGSLLKRGFAPATPERVLMRVEELRREQQP
jgi:xanthine dehydrogenase molybdopterin-binding subunit B